MFIPCCQVFQIFCSIMHLSFIRCLEIGNLSTFTRSVPFMPETPLSLENPPAPELFPSTTGHSSSCDHHRLLLTSTSSHTIGYRAVATRRRFRHLQKGMLVGRGRIYWKHDAPFRCYSDMQQDPSEERHTHFSPSLFQAQGMLLRQLSS